MKKIRQLGFGLVTIFLLNSCGLHTTHVGNINGNMTNVELSKKNFQVVERVSGTSTATYIFGIGGLSNKALIEKAKSKMLQKADIVGGSKAIVNLTTESHLSDIFPFYFRWTVTISGHIVEFVE
ncbi:DUF6567 family protein [Belliella aquatica]|uniref:Lipoprotein n=1 Tax=Belliella aquatica TaxID=1323734 RepID=A0ABQ1MWW3_9BACT|nr:DUF6567 family protein [Belliella aquatica]MCH7406598.1 hypothetical protein [Belliella aquatica]GGC48195.1 hypothetical protein GCM10010993_28370 [Belliella aquatica]